jgi:hypothetical protein
MPKIFGSVLSQKVQRGFHRTEHSDINFLYVQNFCMLESKCAKIHALVDRQSLSEICLI